MRRKQLKRVGLLFAIIALAMTALSAQGVEDMDIAPQSDQMADEPETAGTEGVGVTDDADQEAESVVRGRWMPGRGAAAGGWEFVYADEPGVLVADIVKGSPAEEAGLLRGDVVTALDGAELFTIADIHAALDGYEHGDRVTLTIIRGGDTREISLELETRIGYPLIGIVGGGAGNRMDPERMMPGYRDSAPDKGYGYRMPFEDDYDSSDREQDGDNEQQQGEAAPFAWNEQDMQDFFGRMFGYGNQGNLPQLDDIPEAVIEVIAEGNTALISTVTDGSPAAEAGIEPNSVVIAMEGEPLVFGDLAGAVLAHEPGDVVTLEVGTVDGIEELSVTLGEKDGKAYLGVSYYPLTADTFSQSPFRGMFDSDRLPSRPGMRLPDTMDN